MASFEDYRAGPISLGAAQAEANAAFPGMGTVGFNISGTFVATITFEGLVQEGASPVWVSLPAMNVATGVVATTATTTGLFLIAASGFRRVRARCSAYTSGTATVWANASVAAPPSGLTGSIATGSGVATQELTILASAARTAALNSADFTNSASRGLYLFVNVTAASGTGGLQFTLQGKDPVSGSYVNISVPFPSVVITTTGTTAYEFYPGVTSGPSGVYSLTIPRTWRVAVAVGDASSYTYSIGASLIP